jgi:hypothetical protein
MPPALVRLFSTQETSAQTAIKNDEREKELKRTLGIFGKPALSVTELEKQFLQPSTSEETTMKTVLNNNQLEKPLTISTQVFEMKFFYLSNYFDSESNTNSPSIDITSCYHSFTFQCF